MSLSEDLAGVFLSPSRLRTLTDEDLMQALRIVYNDALAVLFERYSALVFRIARASLGDDGEAEETVQRVFRDVFKPANQFNPDCETFKTWLPRYANHRSGDRRQHIQADGFHTSSCWTGPVSAFRQQVRRLTKRQLLNHKSSSAVS